MEAVTKAEKGDGEPKLASFKSEALNVVTKIGKNMFRHLPTRH